MSAQEHPGRDARPYVVPYLYVHGADEVFDYPSARAWHDARRLAWRYLECALVQAASLRLREANCDIVFVTNASTRRAAIGEYGARLLDRIEQYGVEIREAGYGHRALARTANFFASYYVLDVIDAMACEDRLCALCDVDCLWLDAGRVFGAADGPAIGSVQLVYPPNWYVNGHSPTSLAQVGERLTKRRVEVTRWIGGELLTGTGPRLRELKQAAVSLGRQAATAGAPLNTEEQLLTLAGALGRVSFTSLNQVAGRIWTGPRHSAVNPERPLELGLWHLPGEKGLAFRRVARELLAGRDQRLRDALADPATAARRFNVTGSSRRRRLGDDAWIATERLRSTISARRRRSR